MLEKIRSCVPLSAVLATLGFMPPAMAQLPPVPAAFPSNLACQPGELFFRRVGLGRIGHIAYHNGLVYTNDVSGVARREWAFADPSDPSSLQILNDVGTMQFRTQQGGHAMVKVGDYAGDFLRRSAPGVNAINDEMPFANIFFPGQFWPNGGELHYLYYPWATPFNWLQYGPTMGNARLWRADQMLAEFAPLVEHGVAGNSILFGNLLFVASDASMLGVVVYDIGPTMASPPQPPRVLDKLTGAIGGYLAGIWEHYLVLSGGANRDRTYIIDFSDPGQLRLVHTFDLAGTPALNAGSNVPYVETQDEYVFTRRHKIDMEALAPVLEFDEVGDNRPAGSVTGPLDVSQYTLPVGNLLVTGGIEEINRDGLGVWCHDAQPDQRAPYVGYHWPRPGQTQYPTGAPISLFIAETLESFTIVNGVSVIVQPIGGSPVEAWVSFAHDGILTITPMAPLVADTTYEVIIPADGIRDVAGNGIEAYEFTFSTGDQALGNAPPVVESFTANPAPAEPGDSVLLNVVASDADGDGLSYRFTIGDGTPSSPWQDNPSLSHTFATTGHYELKVQVRDDHALGSAITTATIQVIVAPVLSGPMPTHSASLALDQTRRRLWTANPDNDSVSVVDPDALSLQLEVDLRDLLGTTTSVDPVSVAIDYRGDAWVACRDADRLLVLGPGGELRQVIDTGYGSAPQAVAASADGRIVLLTLAARGAGDRRDGQLVRYDAATFQEFGRVDLGPGVHAIALTAQADRAFVSRLISTEHFGEIWDVDVDAMSVSRTIALWRDRGLGGLDVGGADGPGVPNYITGLTLSPQQDWLWYTGVKADTNRGLFFRQNEPYNTSQTHDSTVRAMLGRVDLNAPGGPQEPGRFAEGSARTRIDVDNADSPSALAFSPRGDFVLIALQGNDTVAVFDDLAVRAGLGQTSVWRVQTGAAPRSLVWDQQTNAVFSHDFVSRSLTRLSMTPFLSRGVRDAAPVAVSTVASEALDPTVLAGKRQFYFAGNATTGQNAMSFEGYISCASCHLDGAEDGRVWDFTQRGEGLRNTISLHGRRGVGHGNVHWSANFDEIADFELDIVNQFSGLGLLSAGDTPHPSLGTPNAGRSAALDALASYVASLGPQSLPRSPYRQADGTTDNEFAAGSQQFRALGCDGCHNPATDYTDSTLGTATLHDVGTLRGGSGQRLGGTLNGIDTPTLLSVWSTPPYLHDGSALRLDDTFAAVGGVEYPAEQGAFAGGAGLAIFPEFLEDSAFHGHMVNLPNAGAAVTFDNVDGGSGGSAQIELRYLPRSGGSLDLTVNGQPAGSIPFPAQLTHYEWSRGAIMDVPLNPGTTNQIIVGAASIGVSGLGLDEITVANADVLAQAAPHRSVMALSSADRSALLAYLNQLDGSDATGVVLSGPERIFGDGYESVP